MLLNNRIEPSLDRFQTRVHRLEPAIDRIEAWVDRLEPTINHFEKPLDCIEPALQPPERLAMVSGMRSSTTNRTS